jgi:hypothetical protein
MVPLGQFIHDYLITLGLSDAEADEYTVKLFLTSAGKAALALEENPEDLAALMRAADEVEHKGVSPIGLLERIFPDGHHHALLARKIGETLMEITVATKDSLDDETARRLADMVSRLIRGG